LTTHLSEPTGTLATRLWRSSPPLTFVAALMALALAASAVGLIVDPRIITGAPAWLKPAKFAASTAIYSATLAWLFSHLPAWRRTRTWVGWTTAIVFVVEVAVIAVQAWRGTTSHFNISTPVDAMLFGIMGSLITLQTLASIAVAVALWRQPFTDRALGIALRAGIIITIVGAAIGGLMTRPTAAQLAEARATGRIATAGAHTVGAPDGGPGLPGTGWSLEHGDVRVPHFVGLHALQILPIVAVVAARRRRSAAPATMKVAAGSYAGLFGILLVQALRGESLVNPGAETLVLLAAWLAITAVAVRLTGGFDVAAGRRSAVVGG
jgi:hypothetical protein